MHRAHSHDGIEQLEGSKGPRPVSSFANIRWLVMRAFLTMEDEGGLNEAGCTKD